MTDGGDQPKRRGRPPAPEEKRRRGQLTFRIRDDLRVTLEARAKDNGCSISEEIEKTIEREATISSIAVKQGELLTSLQSTIANCEHQISTYKEQIAEYRSIVADYKKFSENVKKTNQLILVNTYGIVSTIYEDMKDGKDISEHVGSKEIIEGLLDQLRGFIQQDP